VTETSEYPPRPERPAGWLSDDQIAMARRWLPILYVDAVPVRVDDSGDVVAVGLLLRVTSEGVMSRALVSGRVMYHERVRDALVRHIEKDLGPLSLPRIGPAPQPFMIAEYFPTKGIGPFHDARQHAVSLAFVVPVDGECEARQEALDIVWLTPEEATSEEIGAEMHGGQDVILRRGLASHEEGAGS